jgi:hypothetical protein
MRLKRVSLPSLDVVVRGLPAHEAVEGLLALPERGSDGCVYLLMRLRRVSFPSLEVGSTVLSLFTAVSRSSYCSRGTVMALLFYGRGAFKEYEGFIERKAKCRPYRTY